MEKKILKLDAPLLSRRQIPTKPSQSDNTKKPTPTREKVKDSCLETKDETLIQLLQNQRCNHVMKPSSVPFMLKQIPEKPKNHLLHHRMATKSVEEEDLSKALEMDSSAETFSFSCSTNGVSDEFEKNMLKDDVIFEYSDVMMSRFLPDAKAVALKQKKQSIILQRVSMAIKQDLNNHDDVDDDDGIDETMHSNVSKLWGSRRIPLDLVRCPDRRGYSYPKGLVGFRHTHPLLNQKNVSKKALLGFLPRFCAKNSLDVLNPVLCPVKTCQNLVVKSSKIVNPKSLESVYKPQSEQIRRNPSRLNRRMLSDQFLRQDTRLLVEEVKRRSNRTKNRSVNLSVSQPPLPKTPTESWLCQTLPRTSLAFASVVISGQADRLKKTEEKTNSQSINWETIVKTSL